MLPTRHALVAITTAVALAACTPSPKTEAGGRYAGIEVEPAEAKQDFTLTATDDGQPFRFRAETDGHVTLLFFGYTACPDVCPVHMANIAEALARLSPGERQRVRVVFVSTDPDRDTPQRIESWLANFDSTFIGVRGTLADVHRVEQQFGLAQSTTDATGPADTSYAVGHAAQILAFTPDDSLRVYYPFGTRQQDWARDLPRLIRVGSE